MKTANLIAGLVALVLLVSDADAGRRGWASGGCSGGSCAGGNCSAMPAAPMPVNNCPGGNCPAPSAGVIAPAVDCPNGNCAASVPATPKPVTAAKSIAPATVGDPLAQVNARRAAAGLRPYVLDPGLQHAATACVQYRARLRIRGHVIGGMGDFQFVPAGTQASAAGADGPGATAEFATCAMYDGYTAAGAASAQDANGNWYHQLFVR